MFTSLAKRLTLGVGAAMVAGTIACGSGPATAQTVITYADWQLALTAAFEGRPKAKPGDTLTLYPTLDHVHLFDDADRKRLGAPT